MREHVDPPPSLRRGPRPPCCPPARSPARSMAAAARRPRPLPSFGRWCATLRRARSRRTRKRWTRQTRFRRGSTCGKRWATLGSTVRDAAMGRDKARRAGRLLARLDAARVSGDDGRPRARARAGKRVPTTPSLSRRRHRARRRRRPRPRLLGARGRHGGDQPGVGGCRAEVGDARRRREAAARGGLPPAPPPGPPVARSPPPARGRAAMTPRWRPRGAPVVTLCRPTSFPPKQLRRALEFGDFPNRQERHATPKGQVPAAAARRGRRRRSGDVRAKLRV